MRPEETDRLEHLQYSCLEPPPPLDLSYLGLSGLGGLSMKLLLVAMEIGMAGMFFNKDEGSEEEQAKKKSFSIHQAQIDD